MVGITEANPEEEGLWRFISVYELNYLKKDYYYASSIFIIISLCIFYNNN